MEHSDFSMYWECHHPNSLSYFSEGLKPPTRLISIRIQYVYIYNITPIKSLKTTSKTPYTMKSHNITLFGWWSPFQILLISRAPGPCQGPGASYAWPLSPGASGRSPRRSSWGARRSVFRDFAADSPNRTSVFGESVGHICVYIYIYTIIHIYIYIHTIIHIYIYIHTYILYICCWVKTPVWARWSTS